ncbi:MAG: alpha/beta hydrolase, partial [Bulleidia sp.]
MVGNRRRILILAAFLLLSGCRSASEAAAVPSFSPTPSATPVPEPKVVAEMDAESLPGTYLEAMENGGTIESITYSAQDYADGDGSLLSKKAEVYLPSGYSDSSDSYPLIILMHGWQGNDSTIFTAEDGAAVNVLDHMISDGMIPACIVVTPTFDTRNKSASWEKSETELEPFAEETRNDLLPSLLENYRISEDRNDHYFGGFSMGGVTTW